MSRVEERIVGNYVLRSLIGKGATSEVYAAAHRFLGHEVAIKLLREELAADDAAVAAFVAEAARTREIDHPAVVRVLDFGRDEESGRCYLVMERIAGGSLAARLREEGRLDEPTVRRLGAAIADGMQAAHARGIIHRDLKPGNIMLRGDAPAIIDFGISKHLGTLAAVVTSRRIGTLAYMAPEQLTGGLISPAVDVWALGVILFEAATGRLPLDNFADGRWPQLFDAVPRATSLAPVSPALDAILARCLASEPGARFSSMDELARALRAEAGEERITADLDAGPWARFPGRVLPAGGAGGGLSALGAEPLVARAPLVAGAPDPSRGGGPSSPTMAPPAPPGGGRGTSSPIARGALGAGLALVALVAIVAASAGGSRPEQVASTSSATASVPAPAATDAAPAASPDVTPAVAPDAAPGADLAPVGAQDIVMEPEPAPAPALAEVVVRSTPRGAVVLVDGKARGRTPARLEVRTPTTIVVRRPGYRTARVRVEEPGTIHVPLARARRTSRPRTSQGETLD